MWQFDVRSQVRQEFGDTRQLKGTAMQTEKSLINDRLRVSKVCWNFCILTIYDFTVIYPWVFVFYVCKQKSTAQ